MRTQIATNVSLATRRQADELMKQRDYTLRDVVTIGVRMLYESEGLKMMFVSDYDPQKRNNLEADGFIFTHETSESPCPTCGAKRWAENFSRRIGKKTEYKSVLWSQCLCAAG